MKVVKALLKLLFSWLIAPWAKKRAVLQAAAEHDEYEEDRVKNRKRLGFSYEQREVSIQQRASRKLRGTGIKVSVEYVRKTLGG